MSSIIVFTPDIQQPSLTSSAELNADQIFAIRAFVAAQNAQTPGKYPTELSLLVSNLRTGLLTAVLGTYPPPAGIPEAMSGIVFVPDASAPTENLQGDVFTDAEMRALASFVAQQNAQTPGRYAGVFACIMSNLHDGLFSTLLQLHPSSTVSSAQAAVVTAQATATAALAAANPLIRPGADPATIPPYPA